jgi:hypothetical protein
VSLSEFCGTNTSEESLQTHSLQANLNLVTCEAVSKLSIYQGLPLGLEDVTSCFFRKGNLLCL